MSLSLSLSQAPVDRFGCRSVHFPKARLFFVLDLIILLSLFSQRTFGEFLHSAFPSAASVWFSPSALKKWAWCTGACGVSSHKMSVVTDHLVHFLNSNPSFFLPLSIIMASSLVFLHLLRRDRNCIRHSLLRKLLQAPEPLYCCGSHCQLGLRSAFRLSTFFSPINRHSWLSFNQGGKSNFATTFRSLRKC